MLRRVMLVPELLLFYPHADRDHLYLVLVLVSDFLVMNADYNHSRAFIYIDIC